MQTIKKCLLIGTVAILAFLAGSLYGNNLLKKTGTQKREGVSGRLINPLVFCEVGDKNDFKELKPLETKINELTNKKIANGF